MGDRLGYAAILKKEGARTRVLFVEGRKYTSFIVC